MKNDGLGGFLRTRRARLQPGDVGIPATTSRRVPGLRREEVALVAGVSPDYYARLEQGRDLQPSDQVLDAIARALRMSEVERRHLHHLIRGGAAPVPPAQPRAPLREGTRLLLDSLPAPAMVLDTHGDVHAINHVGSALLVGLEALPSNRANHTRWLFRDPAARDLLLDWEEVARSTVRVLRAAVGRAPQDPVLRGLIGELDRSSPEFRTLWAEHDVATRCSGVKRFRHPVVGDLELHIETLQLAEDDRWLYTYVARPGSPTEESLRLLESWAAAPDRDAAARGERSSRVPAR